MTLKVSSGITTLTKEVHRLLCHGGNNKARSQYRTARANETKERKKKERE